MTTNPQPDWRVWKYELNALASQTLTMPKGAQVLHVGAQDNAPVLWARIDATKPMVERQVVVTLTGHPAPPPTMEHVGTVLLDGGRFVVHIFILPEKA